MTPLPAVLVNPGVPVPTAPVFKALGLTVGETRAGAAHPVIAAGLDRDALVAAINPARNDLEAPALTVAPVIGEVLAALRARGCRLARMSGSGATVFALFSDRRGAVHAASALRQLPGGRQADDAGADDRRINVFHTFVRANPLKVRWLDARSRAARA